MQQSFLSSVLEQLHASEEGLTSDEVERRLDRYGFNEPTPARRMGAVVQLALLLANPLCLILLMASLVSALLGEVFSAAIIVTMVLLNVVLNFLQTYRSQRAAERLREQVAPTATVRRDGAWVEKPRRELVPGDLIRLVAGDLVPADALLLQARDLHVQQAALTGESLPAEKEAVEEKPSLQLSPDARNRVFLGTSVVSGTATALVVATGRATAFGDIAIRLTTRPPESEFERGTRRFGFLILETVLLLVLFLFLISIYLHRDPLESMLFAVALAVGLTPEFLPMIVGVTLAQGAVRMARRKVIVKHLAAMQNFGSMDVLCSDKTGTLTSGEMTVARAVGPFGQDSPYVLRLARLNSYFETGIKSPLDAALLRDGRHDAENYRKLDEVPFDFERRRLSVVIESASERWLITKGAAEAILAMCSTCASNETQVPMNEETRTRCETVHRELSATGCRVLAVAFRAVPQQDTYGLADEKELVLAGFISFSDPPLPDAAAMLAALRRDGVAVKILTGDSELVARHVCERVGLDGGRVVRGEDVDQMSDSALIHVAEQTNVFARMSPAQKNRVLLALKQRGHVVGFLGDGINDAPSLHAADVGISVASAVDIARDAAEVILLEHSLAVLHTGILEGRKAFGNVMKYLLMGTSSNFGNMFSMAAAAFFLPFLPMLPAQILLNNFLYDLSQITIPTDHVDDSFIVKPRRWDISLIRNFMVFIGPISSLYDFLTFFILLRLFHASEPLFHTGWFVESLVTQTLVLFVIRTAGNPFRSRPSLPLLCSVLLVVFIGVLLPYSPLAGVLGFTPLPALYLLFLAAATGSYLLLVEMAKRFLLRRFLS
ncbi:MAG TPA: magnesium-translocating P-type ATPase [Gemmataceae bacterium]|jgi:Mg2+-importing ATPase